MNYETALDEAMNRLRDIELALNESSIVSITDQRGVIQFVNDKFCKMSKYSREELIGQNQNIVNSGYHDKSFFKNMWRTIGRGQVWKGEVKNKTKDGITYWVDTTIVPFLDKNNKPYQYVSIRHDITKLKQYEEEMEQMAFYDPLTQLPNRNLLSKWLRDSFDDKEDPFTVLFLDLDRFKSINDNFGHSTGDYILKETAKRLQRCLRKSDFISRQGGDEFIIILNGLLQKDDIIPIVQKIKEQLAMPFCIDGRHIVITASIGISRNTLKAVDISYQEFIETLIKQADTSMYHAKKQGGNIFCFNTPDHNIEIERYYQLEQEIKNAIEQKQFSLHYQPLMNLGKNEIVGVEVLLRWNNQKLGSVSPVEFIPLLEELGYIIPVGKWVLKSACRQMKAWQQKGVSLQRISVNVSPVELRNKNFVNYLKQILKETMLDPRLLEIEITEGTLLNIEESSKILQEIKNLGIRIAIDDFGTGYSSLSYLKELSLDTLKIDKSFIQDLDNDGKIIVNTIIQMGKNLGYTVLAEGIENIEQLSYLQQQNCHEGQGYFWSKPVKANEMEMLYQTIMSNEIENVQ
ncbi:sensor domain-containing protein [Bacillus sp. Marseille-P3661]|uniref:sensor domain-containing protein n=1 Tax=Bacillus sp. Marseille-P3661 TaxID=1936234 RepID=UPI002155F58A|nr:EAL domain-containing protein [Bacillus sp. Marseille-P3661]